MDPSAKLTASSAGPARQLVIELRRRKARKAVFIGDVRAGAARRLASYGLSYKWNSLFDSSRREYLMDHSIRVFDVRCVANRALDAV